MLGFSFIRRKLLNKVELNDFLKDDFIYFEIQKKDILFLGTVIDFIWIKNILLNNEMNDLATFIIYLIIICEYLY